LVELRRQRAEEAMKKCILCRDPALREGCKHPGGQILRCWHPAQPRKIGAKIAQEMSTSQKTGTRT